MQILTSTRLSTKRLVLTGGLAGLAAVVMGVGGLGFAATQEENDAFCASCHTQPESTYYERSTAAEPVDLATAHKQDNTKCIDCHSGSGLIGRVSAEVMGAQNAAMWISHLAVQPAPLTHPIGDDHCVKCHAQVLTEVHDSAARSRLFGPKGHYHTYFAQWKTASADAANCTTCHSGHDLGGEAATTWLVSASIKNVCEACHAVLGSDTDP